MAVQAEPDQVDTAQRQIRVQRALLSHVADLRVAPAGRTPEDGHGARLRPEQTEQQPQQGGLAAAVAAEHGEELATLDRRRQLGPDGPAGIAGGDAVQPDQRPLCGQHGICHQDTARVSAWTWPSCQETNVLPAGSVSVTGTTGTPTVAAVCRSRSVSGEVACSL